jgi:hypothetical protein
VSLTPPNRSDQVFQLTLTELAFMLIFLMMLITGWMVLDANKRASESAEKLSQAERKVKLLADEQQGNKAAQALLAAMKKNKYRPDEAIADLRKCAALEPENRDLKTGIDEREQQIAALAAFLESMKALAGKDTPQTTAAEFATAMAFKKGFEEAAGRPLDGTGAARQGWDCVAAQARSDGLDKERQNLVNQLTFMRNQMDTLNSGKGFGPPPCWVDNNGRAQRLLAVEVTEQGLVVRPGWPAERAEDAKTLPNIQSLTASGKTLSPAAFHTAAQPVLEWGRARKPECRHYASVTVSASRVDASLAGQNAVFDHFFPYGKVTLQKGAR